VAASVGSGRRPERPARSHIAGRRRQCHKSDDGWNHDPSRFLWSRSRRPWPNASGTRAGGRDDRDDLPLIADAGDWRCGVVIGEPFRDKRESSRPDPGHSASRWRTFARSSERDKSTAGKAAEPQPALNDEARVDSYEAEVGK